MLATTTSTTAAVLTASAVGLISTTSAAAAIAGPECSANCGTANIIAAANLPDMSATEVDPLANWTRVEQQASVFTMSRQENAAVAIAPDGRSVVVWESRRQERGSIGVFAQAFDAFGRPVGDEVHINQTLPGMQRRPDIIAHPETGAFWIAWESTGQDGSGTGVVLRRFEDASLADATNEIAVNATRLGDQTNPVLAPLPNGNVIVTWRHGLAGSEAEQAIMSRVFDADGTASGAEQTVVARSAREGTNGHLGDPAIASLPLPCDATNRAALVVWSELANESESYRVVGQWIDDHGTPIADQFAISTNEMQRDAIEPVVAFSIDNTPNIAWLEAGTGTNADLQQHRGGYRVMMRQMKIDAGVDPAASTADDTSHSIEITTAENAWNSGVALNALPDGRVLAAWNASQLDGERDTNIVARFIGADAAPATDTFILTQRTENEQSLTSGRAAHRVTADADGRMAAAWFGDAGRGDTSAANVTFFIPGALAQQTAPDDHNPAETGQRLAWLDISSDQFTQAPIPPIWDPTWEPGEPLINPQGDGPDFGFEGVPGAPWIPPDPELAAGPEHIIVMTNGQIACFLKDGTNLWRNEIENSFGFWGSLGADNFVFDPEVLWDPHSQRFMAMANERSDDNRSLFLLAVSKDDRPETPDDWWKYRLDVTSLAGNDIDSPNMGVNRDFITLTADFFGPDKYLVYIVDKNSVLNGGTPNVTSELITGTQSYGVPVMWDGDAGTQYMIESTEDRFGSNTTVIFHAIRDPFSAYDRRVFTLGVPAYRFPASPPQRGTTTRPFLFEPRFWSSQFINGSLWAVHHVNSERTRARWYEFGMNNWPEGSGSPELIRWGEIDLGVNNLGDGVFTFFPSIGVDDAGNAAITYARSASREFISIGRALLGANDPLETFRVPEMVKESNAPDTSGRWGDYSFTQPDPFAENTFWGHHEFKLNDGTVWRTWVAQYIVDPTASMTLDLSPQPLQRNEDATAEVTGAPTNTRVYIAYSLTGLGDTPVPALGISLGLDQPSQAASSLADANGTAIVNLRIPPQAPLVQIFVQAAAQGAVSNIIDTTIQP